VALTTKREADNVVNGLIRDYYRVRFPRMEEEEVGRALFATQPGSGASVYIVGEKGVQ
jgi:hypothetical protein